MHQIFGSVWDMRQLDDMNKYFKWIKREFVYGGHLLSLGAASIVWSVIILLDESGGWPIVFLAYLSSQIVYNHDHLRETKRKKITSNLERTKYLLQTKKYQIITLSVYVVLFLVVASKTTMSVSLLASTIVIGGVLYTLALKKWMKILTGLKSLYVAFFWGTLGLFAPLYYLLPITNSRVLIIALFIFVRWIINSTFFDIKDIESDRKNGVRTFPVVWGLSKTILHLHICNVFSGILLVISCLVGVLLEFSLILLLFPFYSYYYLSRTKRLTKKQLHEISYVMVDGEYILWPITLLVAKSFVV